MKHGIHPAYGHVVFRDRATVVDVDVTSDSHPFWIGTARTLDSQGRVEKFEQRYGRKA